MDIAKRAIEVMRNEGIVVFTKKGINYIKNKLKFLVLPYALLKIKMLNTKDCNLDILLNFSFNGIAGFIKPSQICDEILGLLRILDSVKPKVMLEIGTANGGTLFLFPHIASMDATIISVDLPAGTFGGGYPTLKIPLYKSFALSHQKIHLIRADSHSQSTLERVQSILNGKEIDFLFIDGDHTYEGVKKDFQMCSPLVKNGGIIAFHDIVPGLKENVGGVPKFWQEIKSECKYLEIVKDWNQGGYGIGVIYKNTIGYKAKAKV
ncbi:MAG: Methyltransferase domain protein [Candidatus Argoarchaeum ethanivorans]|uniref:Methyltransferase domain protein n=1 Tax=Candidatus Argoarchaeum ethanivorans TaxID=2608793 RepID=A0A811T8H7_9EURY|nr:MAG: Methyltransferase domain protein [Candidatus Argoarchaeum ethanivorans]